MNLNRLSRFANRPFVVVRWISNVSFWQWIRIVHRVSQIARFCCSMNSESFHGQPLPFHAPPPAPAFTFIYCAVNVNAPADFMKMVPTSPMFYIPSSSSSCALAFVCRLPMGGRQAAGGCACVSWLSLIFFFFCPTFSAVLSIRSYHSI